MFSPDWDWFTSEYKLKIEHFPQFRFLLQMLLLNQQRLNFIEWTENHMCYEIIKDEQTIYAFMLFAILFLFPIQITKCHIWHLGNKVLLLLLFFIDFYDDFYFPYCKWKVFVFTVGKDEHLIWSMSGVWYMLSVAVVMSKL